VEHEPPAGGSGSKSNASKSPPANSSGSQGAQQSSATHPAPTPTP
jgi:hypothetical protein